MRRGPKGRSPEQQAAAGETRPSRKVVTLFKDHASRPDPDVLPPPSGMTAGARAIWKTKVERYRQRGQKIGGFEDSMRQLCELEAALNKSWKNGTATMAMVNAHRLWSAEFFDTPAAQKVPASGNRESNPFAKFGSKAAGA